MLAGTCKIAGGCANYAAKSWSPGGAILLAIIIVIVIAFFRRK